VDVTELVAASSRSPQELLPRVCGNPLVEGIGLVLFIVPSERDRVKTVALVETAGPLVAEERVQLQSLRAKGTCLAEKGASYSRALTVRAHVEMFQPLVLQREEPSDRSLTFGHPDVRSRHDGVADPGSNLIVGVQPWKMGERLAAGGQEDFGYLLGISCTRRTKYQVEVHEATIDLEAPEEG
jgi:hypothetical protein